jgi:hypothetical protein
MWWDRIRLKYVCFMGPIWWLTPMMMPIKSSAIFRPLSLSVSCSPAYHGGGIASGIGHPAGAASGAFAGFVPMIFTSVIQALVFMFLTMMYIAGAMGAQRSRTEGMVLFSSLLKYAGRSASPGAGHVL